MTLSMSRSFHSSSFSSRRPFSPPTALLPIPTRSFHAPAPGSHAKAAALPLPLLPRSANGTILAAFRAVRISRHKSSTGNGNVFCFCWRSLGWNAEESPYDTLGIEKHVNEVEIKAAYRRMAKQFHPDVYDGNGVLHEGETIEQRFIRVQAAYELLADKEKRKEYDADDCTNPLKASKAWMEWVLKKKKMYERGELSISLWAEQQQRDMFLKARRLSRLKIDPEEERKILVREKSFAIKSFESTLKRHTLVLKKREILRKKEGNAGHKKLVQKLLAAEGLELDDERY